MATVRNTITLQDKMTPVLRSIIKAMQSTIDAMAKVDNISDKAFKKATSDINAASAALNKMENDVTSIQDPQRRVNDGFKTWQKSIIILNQGISLFKKTIGSLDLLSFDRAFSRMDTMINFERVMKALTGSSSAAKSILNEVNDAVLGTAYGLDVAAKSTQGFMTRGIDAGRATNYIKTWADAVSFYGEGTNEQLETVTDAMGRMLSKGKVDAIQLNRLTNVGINARRMYAIAVGKSEAEIEKALSNGTISSLEFLDTVTKAMEEGTNGVLNISGAAKEAGATWAVTFANMKAAGTRGLIGMIEGIDKGLEAAGMTGIMQTFVDIGKKTEATLKQIGGNLEQFITKHGELLKKLSAAILAIGNGILWTFGNFDRVLPFILMGLAILTLAWWTVEKEVTIAGVKSMMTGKQMLLAGIEGFKGGITAAKGWVIANWQMLALIAGVGLAVVAMQNFDTWGKYVIGTLILIAGAIALVELAQWGLNAAALANPLVWIFVALIGIILVVIAVFTMLSDSVEQAFGRIIGAAYVAGAFLWNTFVGVVNAIIQFLWTMFVEPFISIIEWVLNVSQGGFDSFGDGVKNLIGNIISWFLSLGKVVTKIIDAIFGTDWTGGLNKLQDSVLEWGKNEGAITLSREAPEYLATRDYHDAWQRGNEQGLKIGGKIVSVAEDIAGQVDDLVSFGDTNVSGGDLDSVGKIKDSISITDEDIKLLKDVAQAEFINRYTTLRPEMTVTFGDVRETADVNKIMEVMADMVEDAYASVLVEV